MRARPPLQPVHKYIAAAWVVILLGLVGTYIVSAWSEPKFGGTFALIIGMMIAAAGLTVLGAIAGIARVGLVSSSARTWLLILAPPLAVAALLYLPRVDDPPQHPTSSGLTIGHLPKNVYGTGSRGSNVASFRTFTAKNGEGELLIGVRQVPEFLPDAEVVERGGRLFRVDRGSTRVTEVVSGVQLEVSSDFLDIRSLLDVAEGLTYQREFDRRNPP